MSTPHDLPPLKPLQGTLELTHCPRVNACFKVGARVGARVDARVGARVDARVNLGLVQGSRTSATATSNHHTLICITARVPCND
jgi:hypothetical protein